MIEFSSPWKIAGVLDPCLFGHFGHTPARSWSQHYSVKKPNHTDWYMQWKSHHIIAAKYSVVNTLHLRARAVCSNHHLLKKEEDHLQRVLLENRYPTWALNRAKWQSMHPPIKNKTKGAPTQCQCYIW